MDTNPSPSCVQLSLCSHNLELGERMGVARLLAATEPSRTHHPQHHGTMSCQVHPSSSRELAKERLPSSLAPFSQVVADQRKEHAEPHCHPSSANPPPDPEVTEHKGKNTQNHFVIPPLPIRRMTLRSQSTKGYCVCHFFGLVNQRKWHRP